MELSSHYKEWNAAIYHHMQKLKDIILSGLSQAYQVLLYECTHM